MDFAAVLAATNGLEGGDARTECDRRDDPVFLGLPVLRYDRADVAADDLLGGVAEDSLGRGVPGEDRAIEPFSDNRVIRGFDDCRKQCRRIGTEIIDIQRPALLKA